MYEVSVPAPILVFGATGFTGRLVCAALAERRLPFAAAGRDAAKLKTLADAFACETAVVDLQVAETLNAAMSERKVVLACAGPFIDVGEPVLASAARAGIAYADTTGEQRFVADMAARYRATAEARGACIAPSLAYEIAPGDWAASLAAGAIDGPVESLTITYLVKTNRGGYRSGTTRGSKRSMLRVVADGRVLQHVDGGLCVEPLGAHRISIRTEGGRSLDAISFPSPEAVLTPGHTKAKTLRTFMAVGKPAALAVQGLGGVLPALSRQILPLAEKFVSRTAEGPENAAREAEFEIVATARSFAGHVPARAEARVRGRDPYGLTAAIQALFAARVLEGKVTVTGVVAPSEALPPQEAIVALASTGLCSSVQCDTSDA
jgi:short subunit dehydrogenase-like uncharacterized protein